MYKDPAFLFYPESFLVGVMYMTDEEVGQYIKLMCIQHQKGHIPDSIMQRNLPAVQEKFRQDAEGKWYNERLETEIQNRKRFVESRRANGAKGGRPKNDPTEPTEPVKRDPVGDWVKEVVPEELHEAFMEWVRMRSKIKNRKLRRN